MVDPKFGLLLSSEDVQAIIALNPTRKCEFMTHIEPIDRILGLVSEAFKDLDNNDCPLSSVIRKAIRIAGLRNDYSNLCWLKYEMTDAANTEARREAMREIIPFYSKEQYVHMQQRFLEVYNTERQILAFDDNLVLGSNGLISAGVPEIETQESYFQGLVKQNDALASMRYGVLAQEHRKVLSRIAQRVSNFLSTTERELVFGQFNANVFEQNRKWVDSRLGAISPEALEQLSSAYKRLDENDSESRCHALLSCRRVLKSLADKLFPALDGPIIGADGRVRKLNDENYINRLWQFATDRASGHASGEVLLAQITALGNRIDALYDLTCKGTHADVSAYEANQCIIETYAVIGAILRLADEDSAIQSEVEVN